MASVPRLLSGALGGIEAVPVSVEADVSRSGDPQMVVVGLPDASVKESRDRVAAAMAHAGFEPFRGRVTVNLAPADLRKEGSHFDLPIALAILLAADGFDASLRPASPRRAGEPAREPLDPERTAIAGELSLDGTVRPVRGVLPLAASLRAAGATAIVVPRDNAAEAAVVEGLAVYPVANLREAYEVLSGEGGPMPFRGGRAAAAATDTAEDGPDFAEVKGQEMAKRAIQIAVAGGHNILMIGPPGTGKSMLARRIPSILPPMTPAEALEATKIHSVAGLLPPGAGLLRERAFRSPHHTVSNVGLIGGGAHPSPGEVTLAHHGVLFLDELPEFSRSALEVMRQPMEDGFVTISRAAGSARFPSRFMLVAAMNPCPCGYYGDPNHECRCTRTQLQHYRAKISGPLLDRIDLHIEVPATPLKDLQSLPAGDSSADLRAGVLAARGVQAVRFGTAARTNASMQRRDLERFCRMDARCLEVMNFAIREMKFSPRAHDRILKVARTIADLAGHDALEPGDIQEALGFRALDRAAWT